MFKCPICDNQEKFHLTLKYKDEEVIVDKHGDIIKFVSEKAQPFKTDLTCCICGNKNIIETEEVIK